MQQKKVYVFIVAVMALFVAVGQERYVTNEGEVSIDASSPLEDIKASNDKVNAILDVTSGEIAVVLLIKDFEFRRKLMQEHFNENYMHSDQYPKAIFTGTLDNFEFEELTEQEQDYPLAGKITIHGVSQPLLSNMRLQQNKDGISCSIKFIVETEEHNIRVPRVLFKKVAREVNVAGAFLLKLQ